VNEDFPTGVQIQKQYDKVICIDRHRIMAIKTHVDGFQASEFTYNVFDDGLWFKASSFFIENDMAYAIAGLINKKATQ
jgi:hypothetical protein